MQTLNVAGHRCDIFVAQLFGDALHRLGVAIVGAAGLFLAEVGQLLGDVLSVLAAQVREAGGRVACAIWRVATGAGWQALGQIAAAEQCFTARNDFRIGGANTCLLYTSPSPRD